MCTRHAIDAPVGASSITDNGWGQLCVQPPLPPSHRELETDVEEEEEEEGCIFFLPCILIMHPSCCNTTLLPRQPPPPPTNPREYPPKVRSRWHGLQAPVGELRYLSRDLFQESGRKTWGSTVHSHNARILSYDVHRHKDKLAHFYAYTHSCAVSVTRIHTTKRGALFRLELMKR